MEAIQFSGGKDSLAVLYLMRDRLKDIPVYFGDTGHVYPHMKAFVERTCENLGATLRLVKPPFPIDRFQHDMGLPSDIVPVEATFQMAAFTKQPPRVRVQSSLSCCGAMLWQPLYNAMLSDGIKTVYRGSKNADHHVGVGDGFIDANDITYRSPIWDWSDDDVFAYLREVGAVLPEHYGEVNNSFDCIFCTAYLNHAGAAERLAWTRKKYPEHWPILAERLAALRSAIDGEREAVNAALSEIDGDHLGNV